MSEFEFDIEALHHVQFLILQEFDRVCKENDIVYYLAFGTLLGAVRHNGFIPWDDDVDVFVPYKDYVKIQNLPKSVWSDPYFLQTSVTDPGYTKCYMKLRNSDTTLIVDDVEDCDINHGVDIDIYPIINLADNITQRNLQYKRTMLYMLLQVNKPPKNHGKLFYYSGKFLLLLLPSFVKNKLKEYFLIEITKYDNEETNSSYVVCGNVEIMKQVLDNEWFKGVVYQRFENAYFPIPVGAHKWLTDRYGTNYMDLPPKEMQGIKLQHLVMVDLNNSYKTYKGIYYCKNK